MSLGIEGPLATAMLPTPRDGQLRQNVPRADGVAAAGPGAAPTRDAALWAAAQAMEASFLSMMLEDAGVGEVPDAFGGGAGEEHFASFLREAQAKEMVEAGGIGLAESLFEAMKGRADV